MNVKVVCPYCGAMNVPAHDKYPERCVDCGKLYATYSSRRHKRLKGQLNLKSANAHLEVVSLLRNRRAHGYKVPNSIDQEYEATRDLINLLELEQKPVPCSYCGAATKDVVVTNNVVRCKHCHALYMRYMELNKQIPLLDQMECEELAELIKCYIYAKKHGYKAPYFDQYIKPLRERQREIGAEPTVFYCGGQE